MPSRQLAAACDANLASVCISDNPKIQAVILNFVLAYGNNCNCGWNWQMWKINFRLILYLRKKHQLVRKGSARLFFFTAEKQQSALGWVNWAIAGFIEGKSIYNLSLLRTWLKSLEQVTLFLVKHYKDSSPCQAEVRKKLLPKFSQRSLSPFYWRNEVFLMNPVVANVVVAHIDYLVYL